MRSSTKRYKEFKIQFENIAFFVKVQISLRDVEFHEIVNLSTSASTLASGRSSDASVSRLLKTTLRHGMVSSSSHISEVMGRRPNTTEE